MRRLLPAIAALYVMQLAVLAADQLWPPIDEIRAGKRFVAVHGSYPACLLPAIGLLPFMTGEPITLAITDLDDGTRTRHVYDLMADVRDDHPFLGGSR